VLDDAQKRLGDTTDLYLARVRFWAMQRTPEGRANLDKLARRWESYPFGDYPRILNALAETYYFTGDTPEPMRLCARLPEFQPTTLRVRLLLFDLAVEIGQVGTMKRVLTEIQAIEGEEGPLWRYAAAADLYLEAVQGKKDGLSEARRLL